MRYRTTNSHSGYTLIELLISVGIITILLSLSLAGIANVRIRSRDTKRIADLQTIQSALEHHAVNDPSHSYPPEVSTVGYCDGQFGIYNNPCFSQYIAVTPKDPQGNNYEYHKPACLVEGTNGDTTMSGAAAGITQKSECSGRYAAYGLHVVLESDKGQSGATDASPADPKSYDLMP